MHGPINVKSLNNTSKWQMGFNLAFKGLIVTKSKSKNFASLSCFTFPKMLPYLIRIPF
jgi:hypothetical protein